TSTWAAAFGVLGRFASKDPAATIKLVLEDAQTQVKEETGAPWFSVLGQPGGSSEGHPAVPETDREKIFWVAAFRSREIYHTEHTNRPSNKTFVSELMATCATGNPMSDMNGTYRGIMYYLEKPAAKASGTIWAALRSWNTKDSDAASKLLQFLRADALQHMEAHEGLVQSILFPTVMMGGDVPQGVPKDDRIVSLVQLFTSAAAMEAWKASSLQDAGAWKELVEDPSKDFMLFEFANFQHFAK
ncbi:unnamed protein product, partial [Symbiodinium natans]